MADNDIYSRAVNLIHEMFSTYLTVVVTIDNMNNGREIKAISSSYPINSHLLEDLQPVILQHLNHSPLGDYLISNKLSHQFTHFDNFYPLQGYIGSVITSDHDKPLGILMSLTDTEISQPENILDWHTFATQLIIQHLFCIHWQDQTENLFQKLNYEISHDNLTGLMNRSYLSDSLERLVSATQRNLEFSLVLLDVDDFKTVNDIYGNYIGDQVLKFISSSIRCIITDENLAFRVTADEFAFITFDPDPMAICYQILHLISEGYRDNTTYIKLTASIGLATKHNHIPIQAEQLMLHASLALHDCQRTSKRHISCFYTDLFNQYHRKTQIIEELKIELSKDPTQESDLYVVLQPILQKEQRHWNYFEVLSRWENNTLGIVSPDEFVSIAEQSGLMVELGRNILIKACKAKHEIEKITEKHIYLSINCSAQELDQSQNYAHNIVQIIHNWEFTPQDFMLEITETALISQNQAVSTILYNLRSSGFRIALDDFGTGYSSLNYVHSYPIDCLKIDASFVRNMLKNSTSEKIIKLIIQLAKQLDFDLIAEGVENKDALDKLYAMGCYRIQGYYYSKPITPIAVTQKLLSEDN